VAEYGRSKNDWLKEFLELPNGIPSHDTFGRLFARIDPKGFHDFFTRWVRELSQSLKGKTVAIDGKKLRGSHDRINGKSAIHMVSAWATDIRLVLGQLKTDDKSNEITAIPELIKTLALEGAIVTIDAMGCQKKITATIVDAGADYVIQVKDNQKTFHQDIALFFQEPANGPFDIFETVDGDHGRVETRRYFTTDDIAWLPGKDEWTGIKTICMALRQRDVNGEISSEVSYFISSLENHAPAIAKSIREHWGIENGLHWCLDIAFREDHCRVRKDHAPENFGIMRHMATNLLKAEKSLKGGLQTKRLKAAWDHDYLLKVLTA
jgi:predicted transposase YbfD/YdcC